MQHINLLTKSTSMCQNASSNDQNCDAIHLLSQRLCYNTYCIIMKCLLCNTSTPEMSMLNLFTKRVYMYAAIFSRNFNLQKIFPIHLYTYCAKRNKIFFYTYSLAYCCLGRKVVLNTCVYGSVVEPEPPGIGLCLSGA